MTDKKKQILTEIFWEMNEIEYQIATHTETEIKKSYDDEGNILEDAVQVTKNTLYITISHKTADEMALIYNFNADQIELLNELLTDDNNSLWETFNPISTYSE